MKIPFFFCNYTTQNDQNYKSFKKSLVIILTCKLLSLKQGIIKNIYILISDIISYVMPINLNKYQILFEYVNF